MDDFCGSNAAMVSAASSGVLASHDSAALVGVTEDDTAAVISSEHDHQLSSPKTAAASFWSSGSGAGGSVGGGGGGHIGMVGGCKYSAAGLSSFDYHQGKWGGDKSLSSVFSVVALRPRVVFLFLFRSYSF